VIAAAEPDRGVLLGGTRERAAAFLHHFIRPDADEVMCAALVKTPFVEAVVKLYNRWGGYSQREPARNAWGPAKVLEALARLLENAAAGMRVRGKDRAARLVDEFHERTKAALYDGQFLAQVVESHCNVLVDEKH